MSREKFWGHAKNEIDAYFHIDYGLKYCIFIEVDDLWISGSTTHSNYPSTLRNFRRAKKTFLKDLKFNSQMEGIINKL